MKNTDRDGELLGDADPYWAVPTDSRFCRQNLSADTLAEFFDAQLTMHGSGNRL